VPFPGSKYVRICAESGTGPAPGAECSARGRAGARQALLRTRARRV